MELETLKTYIENYLTNDFIRSSKFHTEVPIFFDKKPNRSLKLNMDYCGLNNLTIKNRYLLLLIEESLDQLGRTQRFTSLN